MFTEGKRSWPFRSRPISADKTERGLKEAAQRATVKMITTATDGKLAKNNRGEQFVNALSFSVYKTNVFFSPVLV